MASPAQFAAGPSYPYHILHPLCHIPLKPPLRFSSKSSMPTLKDISVHLQTTKPHAQLSPSLPDPSLLNQEPNTTTHLILSHPGQPFRVVIESQTAYPAALPDSCDVVRIRVLIGRKVVAESPDLWRGEERLEVSIGKGLRFPDTNGEEGTEVSGDGDKDGKEENEEEELREIVVQVVPCRSRSRDLERGEQQATTIPGPLEQTIDPIPNSTLAFIFKYRTLPELQHLLSPSDLATLTQPSPTNPPPPISETLPPSPKLPQGEFYICCGRMLAGGSPDPKTGIIPHTGIIACSNEWCQTPGQAWHKSCAGMQIWEEPEGVWFCPECRVRPREQMEVKFEGR
ncbi:putative Zinc finger, FYVE/PHD-type, Zinc finger, RING/FYVE/PHD-type [Septoria linicola]|nr:putative Zinc finger, FYVE/PHD-type, Zinc finger, RING/FYVE/PHD-type [Septoria linicola]